MQLLWLSSTRAGDLGGTYRRGVWHRVRRRQSAIRHLRSAILLVLLVATGAGAAPGTTARIPPAVKPPAVDGRIQPGEWGQAAVFCGLGNPLDARACWTYLAADRRNLYVAVRSEMPPTGRLVATKKRRGDAVVSDDGVELWIAPPDKGRLSNSPLGKGYFQVIVNSLGTLFDRHWDPGYGLPPRAWNVKAVTATGFHDGCWEMEMALPLAQFGLDGLVEGEAWGVNLARNWKQPWVQAALPAIGDFSDRNAYVPVVFDSAAPAVQMRALGGLQEGKPQIEVAVGNPSGKPAQVVVSARVLAGDTVLLRREQTLAVPAGGEKSVTFTDAFAPPERGTLELTVADPSGAVTWWRRTLACGRAPARKWTMPEAFLTFEATFDGESLSAGKAEGKTAPLNVKGDYAFIEGVHGKAVMGKSGFTAAYESAGNLQIPGAVSFWVKVSRDRLPGDPKSGHPHAYTMFWYTQYKGSGYVGIQDSVYGMLNLFLHGFPGIAMKNVMGRFPWKKERWCHVLANLTLEKAEVYLDGSLVAQSPLERPLKAEELSPFEIGAGATGIAFDELRLYSRALAPAEIRRLAMGEESVDGRVSYLPSLNAVAVEGVMDPPGKNAPSYQLWVCREGEPLLKHPLPEAQWQATPAGTLRLRKLVSLPKLEEGTYQVWLQEITAAGDPGKEMLRRDIVVKRYEWQGNALGKSDRLIPPYTPLAAKGNVVQCLLRSHTLGTLGLWSQVEAKGKPILARPVALRLESGGKPVVWSGGAPRVVEAKPHRVCLAASAASPSFTASSTCEFDYDGLMKIAVTVAPRKGAKRGPAGAQVDRLYVEVPVKGEIAALFHAVGEHLRANPGGVVPAGQGVVWGSRAIPQPHVENFIPYLWVGGEERGIAWMADWDKDWVHGKKRDAVELVRQGGEVVIRANLLNGPLLLDRPRTFEFALMASPAKPMDKEWRRDITHFNGARFPLLWPPSWGAHYGWASNYPLDGDFSLIRKLAENARKERGQPMDRAFIEEWVKKVMASGREKEETSTRRHVEFAFHVTQGVALREPPGRILYYTCSTEGTGGLPEHATFGDEWDWYDTMHSCPSFVDYAVWYAKKMLDAGMGGVYVDNIFLAGKYAWPIGEGYVGDDGEIHPSLGLWRHRDHIKRLATMMCERGTTPLVWVHMTNTNLLPILSFSQALLDWEWKYGSSDFQERFTPDYIRAVSIGRQSGNIPVMLDGIQGIDRQSPAYARVTRTGLALILPHEMDTYGGWMDGAVVGKAVGIIDAFRSRPGTECYACWESGPVLDAPQGLLVAAYRRGPELLLVVGNTGDPATHTLRLKGAGQVAQAVDAESGAALPVKGQEVALEIAKHDFRLVKVETK